MAILWGSCCPLALAMRGGSVRLSCRFSIQFELQVAIAFGQHGKEKEVEADNKKVVTKNNQDTRKKVATKSSATKKPTEKKSRLGTSVDGILNRYKKERALQETQLAAVRKRIADLEAKTRAFEEQIAKLNDQESATKRQVEDLDAKRDQEVSELLSKLGVRVDSIPDSNGPGQNRFGANTDWDDETQK